MSTRLRATAHDTIGIVEAGQYRNTAGDTVSIGSEIAEAVAETRLYEPDAPLEATGPRATPTIEVTDETTLTAARRLDGDAACLVFASAKNPGGGFLRGAKAQEEDIARCSALHRCLLAVPQFYSFHRQQHDLRYSDRVIYSPRVPVFRGEDGQLLDRPFRTTFLTCAAPNRGEIARQRPEWTVDVAALLRSRAERVMSVAAAHGHRRLVLGAWGCGVFGNDATEVATAFNAALRMVNRFDHVVFAVMDNRPGAPVRQAFDAATDA